MKKSTKAVLLSALVFPGAGHIYLKKYATGVLLAGATFAALYYLITQTMERAFEISEKIQAGDVPLDVEAITELVSQQSAGADTQLTGIATTALVICWLIGIIHSFRAARLMNRASNAS